MDSPRQRSSGARRRSASVDARGSANSVPQLLPFRPRVIGPVRGSVAPPSADAASAGPARHQRVVLACLSVDLAESTETLARLEHPSRAAAAYRSIVRTAVATHGGWGITRDGDRVVAGFLSPTDAVACAVAIHRASRWHNRGMTDRLDIRIGVQLGETDSAWRSPHAGSLPSAAVEAGRLSDAAGGGQILVSELVSSLAHPRGLTFERAGFLDVGGGAAPISTFEVRLRDPLVAPVRLPAGLDHGRRTPFVGRHAERDRLQAAWASAAAGERRLAVVAGEPGAGKSRLAMEFASGIHAEGGLAMWGRSFEEAEIPYQPFVEALSQYFTGADPQELGWLSGAVRRQLARLVPEACVRGGTGAEDSPEEGDRHRLFEAVSAFMSGVSFETPVLLVLDDLQWADPASLLLLKSLMLDQRLASLMVLGIYRDTDVRASHPLARVLADIERERYIDHMTLGGLAVSDVAEILGAVIPAPISPDLAPSVWEDTAGNPFFAEELIYHVEALGMASDQPGAAPPRLALPALGVPRRLRDRLGRRLQRLSAPTREALAAAAVVGPSFAVDVLGHVLSTGQTQIVAMMDEAVRARLVTEVAGRAGRYSFLHPIVRRALYEHHTANQRELIHARAVRAIDRHRREHRTARPRLGRRRPGAVGSSSAVIRHDPMPMIATLLAEVAGVQRTPAPPVVTSR